MKSRFEPIYEARDAYLEVLNESVADGSFSLTKEDVAERLGAVLKSHKRDLSDSRIRQAVDELENSLFRDVEEKKSNVKTGLTVTGFEHEPYLIPLSKEDAKWVYDTLVKKHGQKAVDQLLKLKA